MKRSAGEGTDITLGDDGRWHAWLSFGVKSGGLRDRRHVSGRTRTEVAGKLRELQAKRDAGLVPTSGRKATVEVWMTHWLDNIAAAKVRPYTLDNYRKMVVGRILPVIGHHRLDRLQPEHIEEMYAAMRTDSLAPATILQAHRILSRALTVAVQRDRVARNVCKLVDAPRLIRHEVQPLTQGEARQVLSAAVDSRNSARWTVALALGLRQGEALGLAWDDVDLENGTIRIRRALQRQRGAGLVIVEPKSIAGRRTIPLPTELIVQLEAHREVQAFDRETAGDFWTETGLVFTQASGKPLDPRADYAAWKALLTKAGVRNARLHDARHTAASLLLLQGVSPRVVMEILGHSQIGLTMNTYSHVAPELSRHAADRMGEALFR